MSYISTFRDALWDNGQLKPSGAPRSAEEKLRTRDDANRKLSALIPGMKSLLVPYVNDRSLIVFPADLGANMIGRSNARRGARRLFAVMQNRRLNQHLLYTIVDEVRGINLVPRPQQRTEHTLVYQVFAVLFAEPA